MNKLHPLNPLFWRKLARPLTACAAAIAALLHAPSAVAQSVLTIKPTPQRVEVPAANALTYLAATCALRIPTNGATGVDGTGTNWIIANVNVSVSGAPAGCTASLVASDGVTPVTTIPVNMNTNNASTTTNLLLNLAFDGTEVGGTTTLTISATGGGLSEDDLYVPLDVAKIWNGSTNAALDGAGNWSDSSQWLGGALQTGDMVVFTDAGEQTNTLVGGSAYLTNSLVDANVTISSLRFALTNANYQNIYINPGVNLAIKGDGGFSLLRDYSYWNKRMFVNIWGTNGTFIQTNENSSFTLLGGDDQQQSILDMSGLGNLYLDVNQLHIDSYQGYPNYLNVVYTNAMNGTTVGTGKPQKIYGTWRMALTNYVKSTFVDPYNYTNALSRSYTLTLGRNDGSGGGSGQDCEIYMGYSNAFNLDSICVAGPSCYGADFRFLNTGSFAKFRNADGVSRMSVFATSDLGGQNSQAGDKTKCGGSGPGVDFTKGTVDMLVDRLYCSMDGTNATVSSGITSGYSQCSGFYFASGTIDANTVILGYQSQGYSDANKTNAGTCYANMYVTNSAVLKVNDSLALGYTTASISAPSGASYGRLNIGPGGTVMANNITVGGPAKTSAGNNITMSGNASLIVSNSIADVTPNGALGTLAFSGGGNNSLTLFINGANASAPIVYLTNLTASGTGNKLVIGGVTNLTFPAYIPLIVGVGGTPISASVFDAGVTMPPGSGLHGTLVTSSSNTIDIQIIARTPNYLVWRAPAGGSGTADWDYTTKNWLDLNTGIMTNYDNPDVVAFDDTPGYATNINLAAGTALTPGEIDVTNSALQYTILNSANQIIGGPALNKYGTGIIEVDGSTSVTVQLNQGSLIGSGSVGGVTVAAGAVLNYSGSIGGSLTCSGAATSSGSIAGTVTVLSGGDVTNSGTIANPISVLSGGLLYNSGTLANIGVGSAGSPQVAAGGQLINNGAIGAALAGNILYVNGTFEDLGSLADNITVQSVTVGAGGQFIPAAGTTGNTTINSDGTGTFPGALLIVQGSTNYFEIDPGAPANTKVIAAHLSFGASASQQTQNGGTLVINKVGATPFSAGQSFQLFDNVYSPGIAPYNTGSSTNTFPVIVPASPGPGLTWDLTHLWVPNGSGNSGLIGVVSSSSGPTLTNNFAVSGTNIVVQFSWDSSYLGYRLESLVTPDTVGLAATNWAGVGGSWTNTSVILTNTIGTNCVFYRLVYP
jgi:hypothetical protein